jgi:hypothetical protein
MSTIPSKFKSYSILLGLPIVLLVAVAFTRPRPTDGLVLYFSFDDKKGAQIRDLSGNQNDGTLYGATHTKDGIGHGALDFHGTPDGGDYVFVPNSPSLVSMQQTRQFTFAAWIKPRSIPSEFPVILAKGGNWPPDAYGGYEITLNANGDNDLVFTSGQCVLTTFQANGQWINGHLNEWIHIAFTLDAATGTARFYVNGEETGDAFDYGTDRMNINFDVPNDLYIGVPDPGMHPNRAGYDGLIDELMVWNRALTPTEIQKVYQHPLHPKL